MTVRSIVRRAPTETIALAGLSPLLSRIYAARGVREAAQVDLSLSRLLSPDTLKGMPEAVTLLADALRDQQRLLVIGDFDADGATSTALVVLALRAMGAEHVDFLVPNRFEFGYGLTPEIVDVAVQMSPQLIVTVDNGISSHAGVARAKALGIAVLVTDHHLPASGDLPVADAIVNPNQPGCPFASKHLAGVGVIFYVMMALRAELRRREWFVARAVAEPVLADFLDLVALGTVADVAQLDYNNRILVANGIKRIRAGQCRPGISALLRVGKRDALRLVASDLGFVVGPRLNAAGRLDDMTHGIQCLLVTDEAAARAVAEELDGLNSERRLIEHGMQQEAMAALASMGLSHAPPVALCVYDPAWHQGVIGILAGRLKERFHRPVIAFAMADTALGAQLKGSARSIEGLHIRDAIERVAVLLPDVVLKFGGHAMAAGLTLSVDGFERFRAAFEQVVAELLPAEKLQAVIYSDGALQAGDMSLSTAESLREAGPWGQAFPEPVFDGEFECLEQRVLAEKHLKLTLACEKSGSIFEAIAFHIDTAQWPNTAQRIRLAYQLDVNEYRDRKRVQLRVVHMESL